MKKFLITAFIALWAAAPVTADAQNTVVSYQTLVEVLSGYHEMPGDDYWKNLEPESTRANLIKLINDSSALTPIRSRAMKALTYFADGEAMAALAERAGNEPHAYLRSSAYEAIALVHGPDSVDMLKNALADDEVIVRLTAARTLRRIGTPSAQRLLQSRLEVENNNTTRYVIERSLEHIRLMRQGRP